MFLCLRTRYIQYLSSSSQSGAGNYVMFLFCLCFRIFTSESGFLHRAQNKKQRSLSRSRRLQITAHRGVSIYKEKNWTGDFLVRPITTNQRVGQQSAVCSTIKSRNQKHATVQHILWKCFGGEDLALALRDGRCFLKIYITRLFSA